MNRYALVDADGLVVNVLLWDGEAEWAPPDDLTLLRLADDSPVQLGDTIDAKGNVITRAPAELPPPTVDYVVEQVKANLAKATTITAVKNALGPLLDALATTD